MAGPIVVGLAIGGSLIYGFGYAMAVMRRARSDYRKTKEALPGLRRGFWSSLWAMIKVGFWVAVCAFILIVWMVKDVQQ